MGEKFRRGLDPIATSGQVLSNEVDLALASRGIHADFLQRDHIRVDSEEVIEDVPEPEFPVVFETVDIHRNDASVIGGKRLLRCLQESESGETEKRYTKTAESKECFHSSSLGAMRTTRKPQFPRMGRFWTFCLFLPFYPSIPDSLSLSVLV
jgi:hypothetical protein